MSALALAAADGSAGGKNLVMNFFQKYKIHIGATVFAFFIITTFIGFGGSFWAPGAPTETVIKVDNEKIPLYQFITHYERALTQVEPGVTLDEKARQQKRDETIRDLVTFVAYRKQAKLYGIEAPDAQVRNSLAQYPAFQENGQFSLNAYSRALQSQLRTTPQEFEEEQRVSIAFMKLRWLIQSCVRVTEAELEMAYAMEHKGDMKNFAKEKSAFHQKLLQEKTMWTFNQWLAQVGSQLRVKPYMDRIERVAR